MGKKQTKEAKTVALGLCNLDGGNQRYKAMLVLTAVHDGDFDLAEKTSSEMKIDTAETEDIAVDDLISEIPNPLESTIGSIESLRFEMNEESEVERKRAANKRKRERAAAKLRQKYKKHPELYKDPVVWKKTKTKVIEEKKEDDIRDEKTKKGRSPKKGKSPQKGKGKGKSKKKKKPYDGAQGGTRGLDKMQVFDIGDERNRKKDGSGKIVVPEHI